MPPREKHDPILLQVFSLYLLLLAFFILLNNISNAEAARERLVTGSLNSAFSSAGRETESPAVFAARFGNFLSDPEFQARLSALVETDLALARFRVIEAGRVMEVRMPYNELFETGNAQLRFDRLPFLRRVARMISDRAGGARFDLDILIATGTPGPEVSSAIRGLAIARAGAAISRLEADGAPRDSLAGGIERGDAGTLRLVFHLRDGGEFAPPFPPGAAQ